MSKIVLWDHENDCCACGACMIACPMDAVSMVEDNYGFKFPKINYSKCISCGKCLKICSYKKRIMKCENRLPLQSYAATSKDIQLENDSTSGGVFATLAKEFLKKDNYICGAVMHYTGGILHVNHIVTNNIYDLPELQGSKYVQSDAWQSFRDIQKIISEGKYVLFCGTPCQVDAIRKLTGDSEYLYTIDLICHGVPSSKMLQDFFGNFSQNLKISIKKFAFRDKECKRSWCSRVQTKHGYKIYIHSRYLSYYQMFLEGTIYRKNCYNCPYANMNRVGDITIGDYWGIENCHKNEIEDGIIDLNKIWSCIIVNSEKGKKMLREFGSNLHLIPSRAKYIAKYNKQLNVPSIEPAERASVLQLYASFGYKAVEKYYRRKNGGEIHFSWNMFKDIILNKRRADR